CVTPAKPAGTPTRRAASNTYTWPQARCCGGERAAFNPHHAAPARLPLSPALGVRPPPTGRLRFPCAPRNRDGGVAVLLVEIDTQEARCFSGYSFSCCAWESSRSPAGLPSAAFSGCC